MPRNITVTWEDISWDDVEEDQEPDRSGGFIINNWRQIQTDDMSTNDLIALHHEAKQDLDAMIECEFCVSPLILDEDEIWICALSKSNIGMNRYEEKHHIHKPEKLWYEVLVDILEEYGAYQDNHGSWYSDYHVVDYRLGIERQYAVHLEWNPTTEEWDLINNEITARKNYRRSLMS
jgi:hypothetical protein